MNWICASRLLLPTTLVSLALCAAQLQGEEAPASAAGKYADVNGMRMYYEVHGEGEPLVLLHWYGSSGQRAWGPFVQDFAAKYKLIIPDLRGHGRTLNPEETFTHRQAAKDVYALLDHLGVTTFRAAGVSSGGMTLLHMATQQPERPQALVLIGATHYFPEQAREIMRKETRELHQDDAAWWAKQRSIHSNDDQIVKLRRIFHEFKDSYDDMNFTRPFLATIRARALIIHGDRDEFFPVAIPVEMYTSIPHAALWIVPNGSHVPHVNGSGGPADIPFVATTLRFLADPPPKK